MAKLCYSDPFSACYRYGNYDEKIGFLLPIETGSHHDHILLIISSAIAYWWTNDTVATDSREKRLSFFDFLGIYQSIEHWNELGGNVKKK
jgi:hypothetical protein